MAFRAPRFSFIHAYRARGLANITLGTATAHADFPLDNLIDDRAGLLYKQSASSAFTLDVDLGSDFTTSGLNSFTRLIIPAGHNLTNQCLVEDDSDPGFATTKATLATFTPAAGGVQIDQTITTSTQRYIRFSCATSAAWEIPELILTRVITLTRGPDLASATDEKAYNFTRLSYPSGVSPTVQHGADQRTFVLEYRAIEGADLTFLETIIDDVGMHKPFWVDPVSFSATPETDDPPIWMKFASTPRVRNEISVPMSGTESKRYELELIESLD